MTFAFILYYTFAADNPTGGVAENPFAFAGLQSLLIWHVY